MTRRVQTKPQSTKLLTYKKNTKNFNDPKV